MVLVRGKTQKSYPKQGTRNFRGYVSKEKRAIEKNGAGNSETDNLGGATYCTRAPAGPLPMKELEKKEDRSWGECFEEKEIRISSKEKYLKQKTSHKNHAGLKKKGSSPIRRGSITEREKGMSENEKGGPLF